MAAGVSKLTRPHGPGMSDLGRVTACATAIASIGAGVIHISAAADHENLPVMMVGFLVVATLQVGLGGLLIWRRPSPLLIGAALALMLSSIGLWLVSRTAGLPFLEGGHMEPIGFKDGVTVLFEVASIPGLLLLLSRELNGFTLPSARLGTQTVGMLGAAAFVLLMPAFIADGGAHHSHDEAVAMGIHDDGHAHGAGEEHANAAGHTDAGGHADSGHGEAGHGSAEGGHHGGAASGSGHGEHGAGGEELASLTPGIGGHGHGTGAPRQTAGHHGPASGTGDGGGQAHGDGDGHGGGNDHAGGGDHGDSHDGGGDHGDSEDHANSPGGGGDHGNGHDDDDGEQGGNGHDDDGEQDGGGEQGAVTAGYAPAEPAAEGEPARGSQIYLRTGEERKQAADHHHSSEPCNPTPEQRAAADALVSQTREALKKYDNNPARALADGYEIAFRGAGMPDRFLHMFSAQHTYDTPGLPKPSAVEEEGEPVILDPNRIESFMYAMTDQGLTAIGGMYMMPAEYDEAAGDLLRPRAPFEGPQMGGCLTRWHDHPDLGRMTNRSGAPTPQMLHVWTYPGLEPFREYDGREMSQLWQIGSLIPDISVPIRPAMITEILLNPDG